MKYPILAALVMSAICANAQTCDCKNELDFLINKVEETYAGYYFLNQQGNKPAYNKFIRTLKTKAASSNFNDCFFILRTYTDYFKDGHLGILALPNFTAKEKDSLNTKNPVSIIHIDSAKNYFIQQSKKLDAIEGIWQMKGYKIAVLKDKATKHTFIGTVLETTNPSWKPGQVKLSIQKKGDNQYEIVFYRGDHYPIHYKSEIYKNVLLQTGISLWAKTFPVDAGLEYVNTISPDLPTCKRLDSNNMLLSIPSFMVSKQYFDSLLKSHVSDIVSTKNLLIDIRGNKGGNFIYGNLLDYIVDADTIRSKPAKILSSKDNIEYHKLNYVKYYEQNKAPVPTYITNLIQRMNDSLGKVVDYFPFQPFPIDTVYHFPKNVAILTDKANLSAAEAFLNYAKQSKKVKQFGTSTAGVIDYMNINTVPLLCNQYYYLYYPVYFNAGLPKAAINNIGIKPDIYSDKKGKNLIDYVVGYLKLQD